MPIFHDSGSLDSEKSSLRKVARGILSTLEYDRRRSAATAACTKLKSNEYWRESRCLLAYLAFGSELDADPVIEAALTEGKNVYVPRVSGNLIDFHRIMSLDDPFDKGVFGIREPSGDKAAWGSLSSPGPTLVLVPGLAFDETGARLGRGAGYYDRFIARIRLEARIVGEHPPLCIGYAYREQLVAKVPAGENDEILDGLITDRFAELF